MAEAAQQQALVGRGPQTGHKNKSSVRLGWCAVVLALVRYNLELNIWQAAVYKLIYSNVLGPLCQTITIHYHFIIHNSYETRTVDSFTESSY